MGTPTAAPPTTAIRRTSSGAGGSGSGSIALEKYQLGRLLGRGSFAKVYLARSLENADVDVAIKVIDKATTVDAAMEPRILREVSVMSRLRRHPNILALHEVMATKSKIFLVMQFANGGDLSAALSRHRRFTEPMARRYFHQVVAGLSFCHQNGVVHRDIKPQNLLLDRNGLLKITDFGLSGLSEHKINGLIHTACGTPAYTAPEILCRKGYDGEKADAWSCGILLYVFLVGSLPFDDRNLSNMCRAMQRRAFELPNYVSKSARLVILRLLDPNPSTRLSLHELVNFSWFRKSLPKDSLSEQNFGFENIQHEKVCLNSLTANAFDIISMSSGLNLSGLLEAEVSKKVMRFTSGNQLVEIEEKLLKTGEALGYSTGRGKGKGMLLAKGRIVVVVEVWEVAAVLWLVEMKLVDGGAMQFGEVQWEELKTGLDGIVLSWHD